MYEIENISYLKLLFILPIFISFYLFLLRWKKRKQQQFASSILLKKLSPNISISKQNFKIMLLCLCVTLLIFALANPRMGTKLEILKRKGVDIVFALDVSKSMLAQDIAPSRLTKSKELVSRVIDNLVSDRIGIIIYAGNSYPLLPITTDYSAAKMFLRTIDTDMIPSQGTDISGAIEMTAQYFDDQDVKNKILVILSDGEDHSTSVIETAKKMITRGIKIFTIGMGLKQGAPIPITQNGVITSYKKDSKGEVVITKLNDKTLKEIATTTNGKYIQANNIDSIVKFIKNGISNLEKQEYESKMFSDYRSQFQWFLGFAILLLLLDIFVSERKTGWLDRFY